MLVATRERERDAINGRGLSVVMFGQSATSCARVVFSRVARGGKGKGLFRGAQLLQTVSKKLIPV